MQAQRQSQVQRSPTERFADALHDFVQASNDYRRVMEDDDASSYDVDQMAERLAQAGDVLQREMRSAMEVGAKRQLSGY